MEDITISKKDLKYVKTNRIALITTRMQFTWSQILDSNQFGITISKILENATNQRRRKLHHNEWGYAPVLPHSKLSSYKGLSRAKWRMSPCYRPFLLIIKSNFYE